MAAQAKGSVAHAEMARTQQERNHQNPPGDGLEGLIRELFRSGQEWMAAESQLIRAQLAHALQQYFRGLAALALAAVAAALALAIFAQAIIVALAEWIGALGATCVVAVIFALLAAAAAYYGKTCFAKAELPHLSRTTSKLEPTVTYERQ